jgi:serine/threonine-protein kinase
VALAAGARLGHYEILALIGVGGMGEVFKAHDPRLDRTVAIKVLSDDLSHQPEARARFEREARAIASLNHPHIATLHDVGRHEHTDFLVMELLEGETLAEHLARGPLPLSRALTYAIDIAAALDQAHRHGVIHRDLKPGNVMITRSGVKLLDFGLAKLRPASIPGVTVVAKAVDVTTEGAILGTVQYMAPEQLEGGDADARTDIFALGTLLHEMVTGQRAVDGKSPMSLMGSILRDTPPPVSTLQRAAPAALDRLIATCLAKDPEDRWQSARDIARELKWVAESDALAGHARARRGALSVRRAAAMAVVVAGLAAAAAWSMRSPASRVQSPVVRLMVTLPPGYEIGDRTSPPLALSPDGSTLAYVAAVPGSARQLFVRALDSLDSRPLAGTEGAASPFFSPDGHWLAFFADGKLNKIPLTGGAPQALSDPAASLGGAWAADDTIYFLASATSGVWKVPAAGGTAQPVTTLDRANGEVSHRWPQALPGGKAIIFTAWTGPGSDEKHLHLQTLATGERRVLLRGASTGRYVGTGHLLYSRDDALTVVPFDIATLQVTGPSVALPERALDDEGAHFSVSDSGTLTYIGADPKRFERRLVWVSTQGVVEPVPAPPRPYTDPQISPDGRYAAFTNIGPVETIWIHDLSRGTQSALTSARAGSSQSATWTSDGTRIVYRGTRAGFRNLFWKAVDGSDDEERLTTSEYLQTPTSVSADGNIVFYEGARDIWVLPLDTRTPVPLLQTPAFETSPRFSPDGRWLTYVSVDSGVGEVYVRPFPGPGGRLQISNGGGSEPVWSRSGGEVFYRDGNRMMASAFSAAPTLTAERPRLLFEGSYLRSDTGGAGYDVAADGRFLMIQPVEPERATTAINVVIQWFDDLQRRGLARADSR